MSKKQDKLSLKLSKVYKSTEANEKKLKDYIYARYFKGVKIVSI